MKYRQAVLTDIPAFCRIEKAQPRAAQWTAEGWQTEILAGTSYVLCAEQEGAVIGFVALRLVADTCEILNVAVDPAYTRQGIGKALLQQAITWVTTRGARYVTLEVGRANLPAQRLYQQAGFKQIGERKKFYSEQEDALILGLE